MNLANTYANCGLVNLKHSHGRFEIIADKVEQKTPGERATTTGFDPSSFEGRAIKHTQKGPTEKWDLPCTRAQEMGWLLANPVRYDALRRAQRTSKSMPRQQPRLQPQQQEPPVSPQAGKHQLTHSSSSPAQLPHLPATVPLERLQDLNSRRFYRPKNFR